MVKLYVMVGIPGSGKSFASEKLAKKYNAIIFSSDKYRLKVCGDENCQDRNQEVFSLLYKELRQALIEGKNCIFDATNVTRKDRVRIFNQINGISDIEVIAYVMRTPLSLCLERDMYRDRTVGSEVIYKFISRYQFPQRFEGFSSIIIDDFNIKSYFDAKEYLEESLPYWKNIRSQMENWDQENPHHIRNLNQHSIGLAEHYNPIEDIEYYAGRLHDVGKLYTKSYDSQGIAHYYNHDSWGVYKILESQLLEYLAYNMSEDELYAILALINYHMMAHKDIRGNNEEKYRKIFGSSLYDRLIKFADADIDASCTNCLHAQLVQWIKIDKLNLEEIRNKEEFIKLSEKILKEDAIKNPCFWEKNYDELA